MKEFKELIIHSGCNKGQGSKKLHQICDNMYASHCSWTHAVKENNSFVHKGYGVLHLEHVLTCLEAYSLVNPDYVKFQKMEAITCSQAIKYQKYLHETMLKSLSVTFLLLRNTIELYQRHNPSYETTKKSKIVSDE